MLTMSPPLRVPSPSSPSSSSPSASPTSALRRRRVHRRGRQRLLLASVAVCLAAAVVAAFPCGLPTCSASYVPWTDANNGRSAERQQQQQPDCPVDRLVSYKVIMHTYWTRELFPKHYPDWRPTAQWTKTIGRSHDGAFNMFSLGQPASAALKLFAETGRSDGLDMRPGTSASSSDGGSVLDEFQVPAIVSGAGRSEGRLFVDSNHTRVSLVTRIVPSPDWFVGVDSFELCVGGSWMDSVTVELDPLDAGTDNGFTFTAPNWPTDPQGVVYRMTSHYPAHPAGSFYYPQNKRLPPIATFQFIKHKEFELSEVFRFAEDSRKYETVQTNAHLNAEHNHVDMNNELSADIELERQHEMMATATKPIRLTQKDRIRAKLLAKMNQSTNLTTFSIDDVNNSDNANDGDRRGDDSNSDGNSLASAYGQSGAAASLMAAASHVYIVPKNNKTAILDTIARRYGYGSFSTPAASLSTITPMASARATSTAAPLSKSMFPNGRQRTSSHLQRQHRYNPNHHHHRKRIQRPTSGRDCRVGHWSEWSGCSRTCGIGEMQRLRKVLKHARRGGRPCPPLQESKWCGSATDCNNISNGTASASSSSEYFKW